MGLKKVFSHRLHFPPAVMDVMGKLMDNGWFGSFLPIQMIGIFDVLGTVGKMFKSMFKR